MFFRFGGVSKSCVWGWVGGWGGGWGEWVGGWVGISLRFPRSCRAITLQASETLPVNGPKAVVQRALGASRTFPDVARMLGSGTELRADLDQVWGRYGQVAPTPTQSAQRLTKLADFADS